MIIGERVRSIRQEKRLSEEELSLRAGLPKNLLWHIENGHTVPSMDIVDRLADSLEVATVDLFLDRKEGKYPPSFSNLPAGVTADEIAESASNRIGLFRWIGAHLWKRS